MSRLIAILLSLSMSSPLFAGSQLVKQIGDPAPGSSNPSFFHRFGSDAIFVAENFEAGSRVWKSDGTTAGTVPIVDPDPGTGSSIAHVSVVGNTIWMAANDGVHGFELWKSDGTQAGSTMVKDVRPGGDGIEIFWFAAGGPYVYFLANDGAHDRALWRTDGTAAGTQFVKDFSCCYPPTPLGSVPAGFVFLAGDAAHGYEPWVSDGTEGGTHIVEDVTAGADPSWRQTGSIAKLGSAYYMALDDGVHGVELWKIDGTEAGTSMVKDLSAGNASGLFAGSNRTIAVAGDALVFGSVDEDLWTSDGTEAGTVVLSTAAARSIISWGTKAAFVTSGDELWTTDGTPGGTQLVKALPAFTHVEFAPAATKLFFVIDSTLWVSDGMNGGTHAVKSVGITLSTVPGLMTTAGDVLLHGEDDPATSYEPWRSDGTAEGSTLLRDIEDRPFGATTSRGKSRGSLGNVAVFGTFLGMYKTDGTETGTIPIGGGGDGPFSRLGNFLYFADGGGEPSRTDGTTVVSLGDINGNGPSVTRSTTYHDLAGTAYFAATDGATGVELWRSNGTPSTRVADINPGSASSSPSSIVAFNGKLYFAANDGTNGSELWTSDGTEAGTTLFKDIHPTGSSSPSRLTVMGSFLYFFADDGTNGRELWRTNGTPGGTALVANAVAGGAGFPVVDETIVIGNTLYFITTTELWKSDGTTVELVRGFANGFPSGLADYWLDSTFRETTIDSAVAVLYDVGGKLVLFADDGTHGREPWVSDGTTGGTILLADIFPGADSSVAPTAATFGSMLFFAAKDPAHGIELWRTDGTVAGTLLAADVATGAASSSPLIIPGLTGELMFLASTPTHGYQLFKYVTEVGATAVAATALSTSSVAVAWTMAPDASGYDLYRDGALVGTFTGLSSVVNGLTPATAYLFRVQPRAGAALGPLSAPDLATTVMFTDDPIVARTTVVKRQHFTELLTAINAVRAAASMAPATLRDLTGATILASDVQSLRDAVGPARTALGFATAWTDPSLASLPIRAVHVEELRNAVK